VRLEARYCRDIEEISLNAAEFVNGLAQQSSEERGVFTMVLAGGRTPRLLYETLVSPGFLNTMPWADTHLFWGDERCVPPDHSDSNYAGAQSAMVSRAPLPQSNIHRIPGELDPPEAAAAVYELTIRDFFRSRHGSGDDPRVSGPELSLPSFDLILLGMGPDGHTASLFPGDAALEEKHQLVVPINKPVGNPPVPRITLSLPVINAARYVMLLVSGAGKEEVLRRILHNPAQAKELYPVAGVNPGRLLLLHDYESLG